MDGTSEYAAGYAAALADVREAVDQSLNLAHLREAMRYMRPEHVNQPEEV